MVDKGSYFYTDQLISLNSTSTNSSHHLISYLSLSANSPLILSQWQQELCHHPDKQYTKYILQGEGFKIGFDSSHILQPSTFNLPTSNPSVITDYLDKEVFLDRMWKYPINAVPQRIHISPVGAIPKKHKPGKNRLIMDLSSPGTLVLMMVLIQHYHPYHMHLLIIYHLWFYHWEEELCL